MSEHLQEQLRRLKHLRPREEFSARSRMEILSTPTLPPTPVSWRHVMWGMLEYGGALALAAILFVVVAGNTPLVNILSPLDSGSLSTSHLRAEAEAIDIQIRLLDVDAYTEGSLVAPVRTTTPATTTFKTDRNKEKITTVEGSETTTTPLLAGEIETETSTISADEALRLLVK